MLIEILRKRRELEAIKAMNLVITSTGELTYWLCDNTKVSDLLQFDIIKGILENYCRTESCFKFSSDYSRIIIIINNEIMITIFNNSIPLKFDDDIVCALIMP